MPDTLDLEDLVITVYTALDDALAEAGITTKAGKLIPRPGPPPEVDDREVLCLVVLQELLGFESDHGFYTWVEANPILRRLFPRRLSRPNWADRRALLTPLMRYLCMALCALDGEGTPPFSLSTVTPLTSAVPSAPATRNAWGVWHGAATVHR